MEKDLRALLPELIAAIQTQGAKADAVEALALALLREHPEPDKVKARFEAAMMAEDVRLLNDPLATDLPGEAVREQWQDVRNAIHSLEPRAAPRWVPPKP